MVSIAITDTGDLTRYARSMVSEMADASDGDSDRSGTVIGETPLQAIIRMGAPTRRVERALDETLTALRHSRESAEEFAVRWREQAADSDAVAAAEDAAGFFGAIEAELHEPLEIVEPNRNAIKSYFGHLLPAKALDELSDALQARSEKMSVGTSIAEDAAELATAPRDLSTWKDMYYPAALDQLTDIQVHGYKVSPGPLVTSFLSDRQVRRIALSVQVAESAAGEAQAATGSTGQDVIGSTFKEAAEDEAAQAKRWTWAVFALVALGAAGTLTFITVENDLLASVSAGWSLIFKALIGLPLYGLAAYCAHVAAEHRSLARHFRILSVQLRSVGAYVAPMSDDQRTELRMILGRQAFSAPVPAGGPSRGISPGADDLTSLLGRALDIAKSGKSN